MLCVPTQASALAGATAHARVDANACATATASASAHEQTKTRVWGFDQNSPPCVKAFALVTPEHHRGNSPAQSETASGTSNAAEGAGTAIVKYDEEFAARQLLGREPVTPGGRTIMSHAAERMVQPPKGRASMSMGEVDQVLDTADRIRKVSPHPDGMTVTVQSTTMPGRPQVIVDAATGVGVHRPFASKNGQIWPVARLFARERTPRDLLFEN